MWMCTNWLVLNAAKAQFPWCSSHCQQSRRPTIPVWIGADSILLANFVHNLEFVMMLMSPRSLVEKTCVGLFHNHMADSLHPPFSHVAHPSEASEIAGAHSA
jgi:hypothetical protein